MGNLSGKTRSKKFLGRKARSFTRYLATTVTGGREFTVQLSAAPPTASTGRMGEYFYETRYSPILPAFLTPGQRPPQIPRNIKSLALLFANTPYKTLGSLRGRLNTEERSNVYFTEGLASIILLNTTLRRTQEIREIAEACPLEYWPLVEGRLDTGKIVIEFPRRTRTRLKHSLKLPSGTDPELVVYVEQISASLSSLWANYQLYFPTEIETLRQVAIHASNLIRQYGRLRGGPTSGNGSLCRQKMRNAIISALVEVSAVLSYAVTQGTSGSLPVLSDRSPFPHHSLLGIGGAIRALNKFTRYLETAFTLRSASKVITRSYSKLEDVVPASIAGYKSGSKYQFDNSSRPHTEPFDAGGDFPQEDNLPLITHFSLRHRFMESKFSVTAASEALTAETMPQWTLMTLSHEIMHSRVRTIFQALFGSEKWNGETEEIIQNSYLMSFIIGLNPAKTRRRLTLPIL